MSRCQVRNTWLKSLDDKVRRAFFSLSCPNDRYLGCKIKALRTKTNTYIKTPVRGDQPVFIITGRKEDVYLAKKEILSAAEHFSQIRAGKLFALTRSAIIDRSFVLARKQQTSASSSSNSSTSSGSNTNLHYNSLIYPSSTSNLQQITIQVRVPYRVVGLVVGPKGATIKRIQQNTNTYIVTPGRDKEPVFEIAGLPENVEAAKAEIESHIAARTGQLSDNESGVMEENDLDKDLFSLTETIDTNQHCSKWIQLNNTSSNPTMTTKFSHHLSLPFPQEEKVKATTYRSISQSSFFPLNDQQFDFNTSFEQISDDNLETVWPNFNFISMKTSMGFA